jgi:hypothetical protein
VRLKQQWSFEPLSREGARRALPSIFQSAMRGVSEAIRKDRPAEEAGGADTP